jgi:oligopeptide transport system substrate-binding protein
MRFLSLTVAIAMALAINAGCTRRGGDIEVELPNGTKAKLPVAETLRINVQTEPPSLDWHKATDTTSAQITDNIMEGLVQYDLSDKDLGLIPGLALKWEPSEQARQWKITLRSGVVWSDDVSFTAQHVSDGWKRLLARETASEYAYFLFGIKNARDFSEGKVSWDQVGVKITSPTEMTVELEKPMSYFPYLLTHHSTYPIRMDVVEKHGESWTKPANIVTLGAYNLKSWQHDRMISLERNEKYYGEKAHTKFVVAYMIIEQATAINLFDSGKLDAVHKLPSIELRKLRNRPEFRETGNLSLYYYGMNVQKPPMDNALVRKAIAMAIDRSQIIQLLAGGQNPMTSWVPAGMFGYEPDRGLQFDIEKAREFLKQAGYGEGKKFPKLEAKFNTNEDHQRIAENIQAQLKNNLGIDLELKNEEWKVYLTSLKSDPPHLFRLGWQADYPDPDNFLTVVAGFSENNRTRWKNSKYDELVLKGSGTIDRNERKSIYEMAQRILVEEDVPVIPLYSNVNHLLISPRVENYPINVLERFVYKGVKLK